MGFGQKQGRPDTEAALGEQQYQLSAQPQTSHRVRAGRAGGPVRGGSDPCLGLQGLGGKPWQTPGKLQTLTQTANLSTSRGGCWNSGEPGWPKAPAGPWAGRFAVVSSINQPCPQHQPHSQPHPALPWAVWGAQASSTASEKNKPWKEKCEKYCRLLLGLLKSSALPTDSPAGFGSWQTAVPALCASAWGPQGCPSLNPRVL